MQGAIRDAFFKLADHAQYQEVYKPDEFWIYLIRKRFSNDYNGLLNNLDNTSFNRAMGELHNSILPIKKARDLRLVCNKRKINYDDESKKHIHFYCIEPIDSLQGSEVQEGSQEFWNRVSSEYRLRNPDKPLLRSSAPPPPQRPASAPISRNRKRPFDTAVCSPSFKVLLGRKRTTVTPPSRRDEKPIDFKTVKDFIFDCLTKEYGRVPVEIVAIIPSVIAGMVKLRAGLIYIYGPV